MTHLKFSTDIDIIPFLNAVKGCKGEVELRTPMGGCSESEIRIVTLSSGICDGEAGADCQCGDCVW